MRIIKAQARFACTDGSGFDGSYRLVTTLLDAQRYPADRLVRLYHERWGATSTCAGSGVGSLKEKPKGPCSIRGLQAGRRPDG